MNDHALQDFARALGLPQLQLDADGHVAWAGGGISLHLEQVEGGLLVYTAQTPPRRDRETLMRALGACHYRNGPVSVRPALTPDNELVFSCQLDEAAPATAIHQACTHVVTLARHFAEPA